MSRPGLLFLSLCACICSVRAADEAEEVSFWPVVGAPSPVPSLDWNANLNGPAEGWHDSMMCSGTPWGEATTMFAQMPAWQVPDNGTFFVRLNPAKVERLEPPFLEVDRISWVINPPSDDLAAVTLAEYIEKGPMDWYQSIEFFRHGGMAATKASQLLTGTVFFKDGRTTGLRANLLGPVRAPPKGPVPGPVPGPASGPVAGPVPGPVPATEYGDNQPQVAELGP